MSTDEGGARSLYHAPAVQRPTIATVERISKRLGMDLSAEHLQHYTASMSEILTSCDIIYRLVEPKPPVKYDRNPGYRPSPSEDPYNAWYMKTDIRGASSGKLANKTVAIKDSICIAGVPMMNGSKILEGYTPEFDATVVTRTLDAGGTIKGKAACENMCLSGSSFTNDIGPALNPRDMTRSAGGSSSGSAILVAAGEVDLAIGGDQGGSIRMPGSWCGVVGLKPTYGLVPYTGAVPIELTVDHLGPMARTVTDCALFLEVLAGYDEGRDHRQPPNIPVPEYTKLLTADLGSVRVGVVSEGFQSCEPEVEAAVRAAAKSLEEAGATVSEVSIPMHLNGEAIWMAVALEGFNQTLVGGAGNGPSCKGFHSTTMLDHLTRAYTHRMNEVQPTFAVLLLAAQYLKEKTNGHFYARGCNLVESLTAAYEEALSKYDVIVMPTMLYRAPKLPNQDVGLPENLPAFVKQSSEQIKNTCPFDCTGHPAITINVTPDGQLPIGMMIIGKRWQDADVLKVAYAYECIRDKITGH